MSMLNRLLKQLNDENKSVTQNTETKNTVSKKVEPRRIEPRRIEPKTITSKTSGVKPVDIKKAVDKSTSSNIQVTDNSIQKSRDIDRVFKIDFGGKKYRVHAIDKETAVRKVKEYNNLSDVEFNIAVEDIFNAIASEIERIVTVAHPEVVTNSYDRWVAVLTEELGEIVHEINDAYEGKPANKNTFVECIQLASATILLAKKFANEHKEMFEEDKC